MTAATRFRPQAENRRPIAFPAGRGLVLALFCLATLAVFAPGIALAAPAAATPAAWRVRSGDTLFAIARRHGLSVTALKQFNSLKGDLIHPGQWLRLFAPLPPAVPAAQIPEGALAGELAAAARDYLAIPYSFGGNDRSGIDCSALVQQFYRPFGIALPRTAREQFHCGAPVPLDALAEGDLLFFHTSAAYASHVGIYLGGGRMLHASPRSHQVVVSSIDNQYFRKRLLGARRLLSPAELQQQLSSQAAGLPSEEAASDPLATEAAVPEGGQ
jgi:peptidoglycan DL-endopeptidase LytE